MRKTYKELVEENAVLWEIVRMVATTNLNGGTFCDDSVCNVCGSGVYAEPYDTHALDHLEHEPNCLILKARALTETKRP